MVYSGSAKLGDYFSSSRSKGKDGLPLLSVTLNHGLVSRDDLERRTETNLDPSEHLCVKEGDIAYNMMRMWQGAFGRADFDGMVSPAYIVLRANGKVDSKYAEYLFKTPRFIYLFWAYSYGLTNDRLRLYYSDFKKIPVKNFPTKSEQQKIAKILSTWDKAIATTEKLLANSRRQKKALMQQLLTGSKRLSGFGGEFKRLHFSDLLLIDQKSLASSTPGDFTFRYISLSDVNMGTISAKLESHKFRTSPSRARRVVQGGDILLATVRPNLQGFAKIIDEHDGCIASTGFAILTPKKEVCGDYVYHYLFSAHITGQINALVVGTNYPAINSSDVKGLVIYCPEYEEQKKIAAILNGCDYVIARLRAKLDCLKQEKQALMQQLLTGRRRVRIDNGEFDG